MTLEELLSNLRGKNIRIWSRDGYLQCSAPKGVLDSQLRAALGMHKDALLKTLAIGAPLGEPSGGIVPSDPSTTIRWFTNLAEALGDRSEAGPNRRRRIEAQSAAPETAMSRGVEAAALSFEQEDYYLDYLRGRTIRKIAFAAGIEGTLLVEAVRQALAELIRRHEALRTTVGVINGRVCQLVHEPDFELQWKDLSGCPDAPAELERERRMGARIDLDIERGPIFWAKVVRMNAGQHVLLITVSHIAMDGWSMAILWAEFAMLYAAFSEGKPSPLDRPSVRYVDYSLWSRKRFLGNGLHNSLEYWRDKLLNNVSKRVEIPADRPRGESTPTMSSIRLELEAQLVSSLEELCVRERTTLFCVLLAALAIVIAKCTKAEDISVASTFGNRSAGFEYLVGLCATPVILRLNLSDNPIISELLTRAHETILGAQAHQGLPPHRVLADLECPDLVRTVHCPAVFLLLNYPGQRHEGAKLNVQIDALPPLPGLNADAADVLADNEDMAVIIDEEADGTRSGFIHYRADLFEIRRIQNFGNDLKHVLRFFTTQPSVRISDIGHP